jgi:serine/threonine-protein kinase
MQRVGLLAISDAVDFVLQALEALAEAHAAGIVHRDLKPANLFISMRPDGSRIVKVLDFGISKSLFGSSVAEMSLTRTAAMIGSPLYMSPEQMRSAKDVDTRTDIWSLGVMLYEMITGRPPYTGDSIPALCASLLNDQPVSMQLLRPEVPPSLEEAVMRCLAKDRQQRFATVSELARALAPYGSSTSQVHVDRASRVQGVTDVTISAFSSAPMTERASTPTQTQPPSQLIVTPIQGSHHTASPIPATVDSWGRTDGPQALPARPARALLFLGLGIGAVALVGIGGFLGLRAPAAGAAPSADIHPRPAPSPTMAIVAAPTHAATAEPPPGASPTATAPPAPGLPERTTLGKPKATGPGAAPKPSSAGPLRKAAEANDLSDFGGRR